MCKIGVFIELIFRNKKTLNYGFYRKPFASLTNILVRCYSNPFYILIQTIITFRGMDGIDTDFDGDVDGLDTHFIFFRLYNSIFIRFQFNGDFFLSNY